MAVVLCCSFDAISGLSRVVVIRNRRVQDCCARDGWVRGRCSELEMGDGCVGVRMDRG